MQLKKWVCNEWVDLIKIIKNCNFPIPVMTHWAEIRNDTTNFGFFDEIENSVSHWLGHILQQMEFNVEFGTFFSHLLKTSKGKIKSSPGCFVALWMSN